MEYRIENTNEKKLVGCRIKMSLTNNKTGELWRNFMQHRKEIGNAISTEFFSVQVYDNSYFNNFDPGAEFEKWAAVEVNDLQNIPGGMESFILPVGQYAVFSYKGLSTDNRIFQNIFGTWLPNSVYQLDSRPHFEILGAKYKNNDPDSEEDIWIPVRSK
jgi:AraC family transcriptional regulator